MAKRRDSGRIRLTTHAVWHTLLLALMAMVAGVLLVPSSTYAAPRTGNYQLDVQVTNGPFSYGGSTFPQFQATLTALNGTTLSSCTGSTFVTISIDTEPSTAWGSTSQSASGANTCVYTVPGPPDWSHYATGLRTATAQATVSGQVVATGTVTFMVNKTVTSISCFVRTPTGPVLQTGSTLQIQPQLQGPTTNYTPDWTQSKFDITLTGPATVTYTAITPDTTSGTGSLNIQAPTTPGSYTMTCTFDGYGYYAPSTSGTVGVEMSAFNQIGSIELYTNPTTYNPSQTCDVYIVFHAPPGGPTPTGFASIRIGEYYTQVMSLASNGTLSVRLNPLPQPATGNQIKVEYQGDSYYRWTSSTFSVTNPAIPGNTPTPGSSGNNSSGSGNSSGQKAGSPQATTTPSVTATGTTSGATPSPASTKSARAGSSGSGSSGGSPLLWVGLGVLVLGLGGGGLALVVRARRAKPETSVLVQAPHTAGWPQSPD